MRKVSLKQQQKLREWQKIVKQRAAQLEEQFGCVLCEYCGMPEYPSELGALVGHHRDRNRSNQTLENCCLLHVSCHGIIHDKNIEVKRL